MSTSTTSSKDLENVTIETLIERYELLLFDAYGVLVRSDGAIDGAAKLIAHLNHTEHAYFVLTNDSSRQIATAAARYQELGLDIPEARVITSGSLLDRYFEEHDLRGAPALVLGQGDAVEYVRNAGGEVRDLRFGEEPAVIVIGELPGENLKQDLEVLVTALLRCVDAGRPPKLVLPNPDLIYPSSATTFGLTAGSVARMFESILEERYPGQSLTFDRLGKPHPFIYAEGLLRAGFTLQEKHEAVMIGDQLATDVQGAMNFGVDAALVSTGLSSLSHVPEDWPCKPTYLLESLELQENITR
ncbi:MAG: HAD hydrolase-like protein [Myxococcota bacterium]|jgi:HAD superfamily hydrolase (TIGR01450 family)|nr:HAD hydrolase-like protein [Myxococcota bacterium]